MRLEPVKVRVPTRADADRLFLGQGAVIEDKAGSSIDLRELPADDAFCVFVPRVFELVRRVEDTNAADHGFALVPVERDVPADHRLEGRALSTHPNAELLRVGQCVPDVLGLGGENPLVPHATSFPVPAEYAEMRLANAVRALPIRRFERVESRLPVMASACEQELERVEVRVPAGAVLDDVGLCQPAMVQRQQRPLAVRFQLQTQHGHRLVGIRPVVFDEPAGLQPAHPELGNLLLAELDHTFAVPRQGRALPLRASRESARAR